MALGFAVNLTMRTKTHQALDRVQEQTRQYFHPHRTQNTGRLKAVARSLTRTAQPQDHRGRLRCSIASSTPHPRLPTGTAAGDVEHRPRFMRRRGRTQIQGSRWGKNARAIRGVAPESTVMKGSAQREPVDLLKMCQSLRGPALQRLTHDTPICLVPFISTIPLASPSANEASFDHHPALSYREYANTPFRALPKKSEIFLWTSDSDRC
jgi:hypothetical protein